MLLSMLFALIYALSVQNKLGHCNSCLQFPATTVAPFMGSEGYGGVVIEGEEIPSYGITTVQGVIPVTGEVGFNGPIHATGTVSIVAKCGPARSCFLPTVLKPRRSTPAIPAPAVAPIFPTEVAVEIPVVRTDRIETVVPAVEVVRETPIFATTRIEVVPKVEVVGEIPVTGTTRVKAAIPTIGEVAFNGVVPAKGTVLITGSCCY